MNWHKSSITEVFEVLGTNQQGLTAGAAEENLL